MKKKIQTEVLKMNKDGEVLSYREVHRDENGLVTKIKTINHEPTKADQTQKEQSDIKNIMKKYGNKISAVPPLSSGVSLDHTTLPTFQESLHIINAATAAFDALPSKLRRRFDNDPKEMIKFLEDPSNNDEAVKLGLKLKPNMETTQNAISKNQNQKRESQTSQPSSTPPPDTE